MYDIFLIYISCCYVRLNYLKGQSWLQRMLQDSNLD